MINPAITVAVLASAKREEFRKKVEGKLKKSGALGSASAVDLEPKDDAERQLIDEALANGTLVKTRHGLFYLNERAVAERKEGQGFLTIVILLVTASLIASGVALLIWTNN
ncbi:MAG TPA: hypothetical protein VNA29_08200 [Sphingomicrobium sp.]|nr:hypothetical protein [Sphingomicrobium sp.]